MIDLLMWADEHVVCNAESATCAVTVMIMVILIYCIPESSPDSTPNSSSNSTPESSPDSTPNSGSNLAINKPESEFHEPSQSGKNTLCVAPQIVLYLICSTGVHFS